jgi:PhzF family phenazine biosynthesis protein
MQTLPIYQADAFTSVLFKGNPAAIIPLQQWLPAPLMQQIAMENNLSETAFIVPSTDGEAHYDIRWFTPGIEINLCGHATLAAAFIIFTQLGFQQPQLVLRGQSGLLRIEREAEGRLVMDFPSWKPKPLAERPNGLSAALGNADIKDVYCYRDLLVELESEQAVRDCAPDFRLIAATGYKIIITAPGTNGVDFVSRFFAPTAGVDEDPVTGSAHSQLIPYWSEKLGKTELSARQLSQRGGELWCRQLNGERVSMAGYCVFYLKGEVTV